MSVRQIILFFIFFLPFISGAEDVCISESKKQEMFSFIENKLYEFTSSRLEHLTRMRKTAYEEGALKTIENIDQTLYGILLVLLDEKIKKNELEIIDNFLTSHDYYSLTFSEIRVDGLKEKVARYKLMYNKPITK